MPWLSKRQENPQRTAEEKQREHIERVAHELYQNRLLLGRSGNAKSDWEVATKIVRSDWHTMLFSIHRPVIQLEKKVWEPLLDWANNQALLGLLGLIGNISIIIALTTYIGSEEQRREAEVLNAWQTITSAHGQTSSGGRIQALEFLNTSPGANWRRKFPWFCAPLPLCIWPRENLAGIDLSLDLTDKPQFSEASSRVYFVKIQLPRADLRFSNLERAILTRANLKDATLGSVNLEDATLWLTNLEGAELQRANLKNATLKSTNLEGVDLDSVNLEGAVFLTTDLRNTKNLTQANFEKSSSPLICNSPLPDGIELTGGKDRDCNQVASVLLERYPDWWNSLEDAEAYVKKQQEQTWD
ncbi:MAG: pentapeptide repeat-containing protein [Cyanobacteria bacterium P01_D01_bin.56]